MIWGKSAVTSRWRNQCSLINGAVHNPPELPSPNLFQTFKDHFRTTSTAHMLRKNTVLIFFAHESVGNKPRSLSAIFGQMEMIDFYLKRQTVTMHMLIAGVLTSRFILPLYPCTNMTCRQKFFCQLEIFYFFLQE